MIVENVTQLMIDDYRGWPSEILKQIPIASHDRDHHWAFASDLDFDALATMEHSPQTAMPMHEGKQTSSTRALAVA